jgi:hypothetical protein
MSEVVRRKGGEEKQVRRGRRGRGEGGHRPWRKRCGLGGVVAAAAAWKGTRAAVVAPL